MKFTIPWKNNFMLYLWKSWYIYQLGSNYWYLGNFLLDSWQNYPSGPFNIILSNKFFIYKKLQNTKLALNKYLAFSKKSKIFLRISQWHLLVKKCFNYVWNLYVVVSQQTLDILNYVCRVKSINWINHFYLWNNDKIMKKVSICAFYSIYKIYTKLEISKVCTIKLQLQW